MSECRIWLDVANDIYATVSPEDYQWALQWRWQITWDRHKSKAYATRSTTDGRKSDGRRRRVKLYLHKEILKRSGKEQPSPRHHMGDHGDGDSLNCQRYNLSWATPQQNRNTARPPRRADPEPRRIDDLPF